MFLFILWEKVTSIPVIKFKYISCSYLSWRRGGFLFYSTDLNTSHVLIYLPGNVQDAIIWGHLNTSHVLIYPACYEKYQERRIRFKYISCSYLSGVEKITKGCSAGYLNTSHVLIYHRKELRFPGSKINLNTSHVLIYLKTRYLEVTDKK